MTWDRSRELCPDLDNCSDPSEKSDERVRSKGRRGRETSSARPSGTRLTSAAGLEQSANSATV
jgi:hypothetical protein